MATSEVFRPSDGNLLVRDFLAHGATLPIDTARRVEHRPQTQGGYRFGRLSHNSFFTRHNPHPNRVKHLKGLLGVPICTVNDDGYFANPRYSLQFPPNSFDSQKLTNWKGRIPTINPDRHTHPPKELANFQRFSGLNGYPFKEKAIPRVGLVPVTETWRDELASFTRGLAMDDSGSKESQPPKPVDEARPRTTVYSPETGRIIPPPSRAVTRGQSRKGYTGKHQFIGGNFQHISAHPEWENLVLMMLCQILQTDDINAVQAWLCSAGDREKGLVMNLVKNAISSEDDYRQYPAEFIADVGKTKLPPIIEKNGSYNGEVNRLVLDDGNQHNTPTVEAKTFHNTMVQTEENTNWVSAGELGEQQAAQLSEDDEDTPINPPINDILKSIPNPAKKTLTPLQTDEPVSKQEKKKVLGTLSKSKQKQPKSSFKDKIDSMWSQNQSVNTF